MHRVAVIDREASDGSDFAAAIGGTFHPVDVTDLDRTQSVLDEAVNILGGLHIVVSNGSSRESSIG